MKTDGHNARAAAAPNLPPEVLALLRCPATGTPLRLTTTPEGAAELTSDGGWSYPIEHGIPVLVVERGRRTSPVGRGAER